MGKNNWTFDDLAKKTKLPNNPALAAIEREKKRIKKEAEEIETARFIRHIKDKTGVELVAEYQFHPVRKWRMDFCHLSPNDPNLRFYIEVDGGAFSGGRHTRGKGFVEDMKKRNAAVCMGYRPIHIIPSEKYSDYLIETIQQLIGSKTV